MYMLIPSVVALLAAQLALAAPQETTSDAPDVQWARDVAKVTFSRTTPALAEKEYHISQFLATDSGIRNLLVQQESHPSLAHLDQETRRDGLNALHQLVTSPTTCHLAIVALRDAALSAADVSGPNADAWTDEQADGAAHDAHDRFSQSLSVHLEKPEQIKGLAQANSNKLAIRSKPILGGLGCLAVSALLTGAIVWSISRWTGRFWLWLTEGWGVLALVAGTLGVWIVMYKIVSKIVGYPAKPPPVAYRSVKTHTRHVSAI
ncbi:hypothetical protein CXG81DRAFT_25665 [Caulochytrium protostelioides]|uniref:Uncharacterized protein n=1 Tax=Caulochytrium protostelioides TaxID=1555241 RepID=A0A4P9X8T4_9FUNG|nr:hypothetical protein CXG81DRAFT_25665 [Caulochytrium protostelioides]|eukprot:RKP01696.1 hypothetical protein CXG81DRAFT_25665 [Caulochytrium protostelioides]